MPDVVCKDTVISARARRMLEYENHNLAFDMADALDISILKAYDLLHEMKLFLLLCALHEGQEIAVPQEIDRALHLFIKRPEFAEFCKECVVGTIEHVPRGEPMSAADIERTLECASKRYAKHFDRQLWSQGLPVCTGRFKPN